MQKFEQDEQFHLPDAGFLTLAIHCTLTIQQLREGGDKGAAPKGLRPAGNHAARLVMELNRAFGLTLPPDEAQYLELYLSAYLGAEEPWGSAQEMELRNLEAVLIREVEKELQVDLSGYASLRDDLYCHLLPHAAAGGAEHPHRKPAAGFDPHDLSRLVEGDPCRL